MQWTELFVIGSLGFWVLLLIEAVLLVALIEWGKGLFATLSLLASLLLLHILGDTNVLGFANHNPLLLVFGFIGYFATGTLWSIARWWLFVRYLRQRYDETRADFCHQHDIDGSIPDSLQAAWQEQLQGPTNRRRMIEIPPRVRQHRGRIMMWMAYWPWSVVWTILHDPVRKAFKIILHHIHDYLQEISNKAFQGIEDDLRKRQPKQPGAVLERSRCSTDGERAAEVPSGSSTNGEPAVKVPDAM